MFRRLKTTIRDLIPSKHQVFLKYWYSFARGYLEQEMELLGLMVRAGDHVVDVGGNWGAYAYRLARLGARVEVFEPNPACSRVLKTWSSRRPGVTVHSLALSSQAGTVPLSIPVDDEGVEHDASASVDGRMTDGARIETVAMKPLDSYAFADVQLIKIDVEGHEYSVLEGAKATLRASHPALLVEIEQRHLARPIGEVFALVVDQGYRGFFLQDGKLVPLQQFDVERDQAIGDLGGGHGAYHNNFLFLHAERLDRGDYAALVGQWMA